MGGHYKCCVQNCKNTRRNNKKCKFYKFPRLKNKMEQRNRWIAAVNKNTINESLWIPKPHELICSDHFISGKKSEVYTTPNYIPTIFPSVHISKKVQSQQKKENVAVTTSQIHFEESSDIIINQIDIETFKIDQECQVEIFTKFDVIGKTFICNRYIYNEICHAEVQTEIENQRNLTIRSNKKVEDKGCNTYHKTYADQSTTAKSKDFAGISSVCKDEQLIDIAGVTFNNFKFLLNRMITNNKYFVSKQDRLLIFLMKIKTGLTFSALSVLFGIHRTTISRIFFSTLEHLAGATANLVFWPKKYIVQSTMPDCFRPDYSSTRVIIDCTEFRIEIPAKVDNRVFCYSHYKKGFTAKVLIGITPGGFICFKSKVAGGRKSDCQMTIESRLIDYLEDGDVVLADKGFPQIKTVIDNSGKDVTLVMPPFLQDKKEFSKEETEQTYNIAKVRIHVERIMQRLRVYQILNKIPEHLFGSIDDIIHICCVLVNLQPPIFSNKKKDD